VPYIFLIITYEKLIVSVPEVNVVTLSEPSVAVDDTKPLPTVIVLPAG
jgi:hypothetical protein